MVSGIYVCHWPDRDLEYSRCEVLLHRTYHNDVPPVASIVAAFAGAYQAQDPWQRTPFIYIRGVSYISLWAENDVVFLAVARRNVNAMSVISLLSQLQALVALYFHTANTGAGTKDSKHGGPVSLAFSREAVVDNHALMFELLDECVDFGLAQVTDYNILKEYIKMDVHMGQSRALDDRAGPDSASDSDSPAYSKRSKSRSRKKKSKFLADADIKSTHNRAVRTDVVNDAAADFVNSSIVRTQVSAISWRPKGIFYPKNEIYVDLIEELEFLYDLEAQAVRMNQIQGVCVVRSYLSGMPVCKLGLNEKYISQVAYDEDEDEGLGHDETEKRENYKEQATKSTNDQHSEYQEEIHSDLRTGNQIQVEEADDESDSEEEAELLNKADIGTELKESVETDNEPFDANNSHSSTSSRPVQRVMKVPITNVSFHSCVELSKVYKENLIFFTPPDDEFRLFSYTVEQQRRKRAKPLLMVSPVYRVVSSENKLQIMCTLHTNFRKKLHCNKVVVRLPVCPQLFHLDNSSEENFRFRCEIGEVRFSVDSSEILWAIGDLPGSKKAVRLMAEVKLSGCEHLSEATIAAEFQKYTGNRHTETAGKESFFSNGDVARGENTGNGHTGNEHTGNEHTGNEHTGNEHTGNENTENENTENEISGIENTSEKANFVRDKKHTSTDSHNEPDSESTIAELDRYYGVGHTSSSVFTQLQQKVAGAAAHEISVAFEMPMFTYSGLKVTYLRVDEDTMKYTCFPWVRYATRAGTAAGNSSVNAANVANAANAKFRYKMGPANFTIA